MIYRTGPSINKVENTARGTHQVSHWFDAFGIAHKFEILPPQADGGQVSVIYRSRSQSDEFIQNVKKLGWQKGVTFGQKRDPCVGLYAKVMSIFQPAQYNVPVTVVPNFPGFDKDTPAQSGNKLQISNIYATTDVNVLQKLDPNTLEPLGFAFQKSLHPSLKGPGSAAHVQRDPKTGDLFNFNLELGRHPTYRVFRVNAATGTTDILATVSDPELSPAYIHSLFLTENYVILCIPVTHYGWNGLKVLWERNVVNSIKPFDESQTCKWLVVDRRHGRGLISKFSTPAGFFFHSINAFEEKSKDDNGNEVTSINLDYVEFADLEILTYTSYDVLLNRNNAFGQRLNQFESMHSQLVRQKFTLSPQTNACSFANKAEKVVSIPSPHSGELPTINNARATKTYRYVYSVCVTGRSTFLDAVVKTDLETHEAVIWHGPRGHSPGEAIFVARPGGSDEDDGVLLSIVVDGTTHTSYLLCLDAKTMTELGRAEADFSIGATTHGFHMAAPGKSML